MRRTARERESAREREREREREEGGEGRGERNKRIQREYAAREVGGTVLSGAPDRMRATSREAVQFINVIYGEANAFPEPRSFLPAVLRQR